ncbi:MAG: hypothetical protein IKQ59_02880 [Prevotella sp.]|nr:hypothetical protein [Prevotella sp.]
MLYDKEKFCPNCGDPISPFYANNYFQSTNNTKESITSVWGITLVVIIVFVGFLLYSSNDDNSSSNSFNSVTNFLKKERSQEEIQSIKDIGEMQKAIDNSIWTYTKRGSLFWVKLEFKGDKVRVYNAMPSDGKWTFDEECPYTLEEGRFIDDGRRYIAAVIKCKNLSISPKFVITNGRLSWLGIIDEGGFILGDYEWD